MIQLQHTNAASETISRVGPVAARVCGRCKHFALMEEMRQLKGLRKVRLKVYGPGDQEIDHLDAMIRERLSKLLAA